MGVSLWLKAGCNPELLPQLLPFLQALLFLLLLRRYKIYQRYDLVIKTAHILRIVLFVTEEIRLLFKYPMSAYQVTGKDI